MKMKRNHKGSRTEPYHLFRFSGNHFVFDTTGCRFYQISPLMSDLLQLCLSHPLDDAEKILLETEKCGAKEIKRAARELAQIGNSGLFKRNRNYINLQAAKKEFRKTIFPNKVEEVELMLAECCNLACRYCYCATMRDLPSKKLMPKGVAGEAIDFLMNQDRNSSTITLFGGEPLLNKPAVDFIMSYSQEQAELHDKKFRYVITTNATLLDNNTINYIVKYNFGLMVSLDGPKEVHDRQCPTQAGEGSFDAAATNIKKLMKYRTVGVRATVAHPMPDLKELVRFFSDFGFSIMTIGIATNREESPSPVDFTHDDFVNMTNQQNEMIPWVLEYLKDKKLPPYFPDSKWFSCIKNGEMFPRTRIVNCIAGHGKVAVDAEGSLYPCAKYCGMENWKIGTLAKGVDDKKVETLWLDFLTCIQPKCGRCWAYPICGGPCIWECSRNDGTFLFNDCDCFSRKGGIERAAYLHFKLQEHLDKQDFIVPERTCKYNH